MPSEEGCLEWKSLEWKSLEWILSSRDVVKNIPLFIEDGIRFWQ